MLTFFTALTLFAFWYCFVCYVLARLSGWLPLAARYRATTLPAGKRFRFQSGKVGLIDYNSCLTIGIGEAGLYLAVLPLFRMGHAPVLIPWSDLHEPREVTNLWCWRFVEMSVSNPAITMLRLPLAVVAERPIGA